MFTHTAPAYDRMNDLLSLGMTRGWRRQVRHACALQPGERALDVAAGTGTSTAALSRPGVELVAVDFSEGMLEQGRARYPELSFVQADATALPFEDASFDAVTISFGLRNVQHPEQALAEMLRVLRPGGRVVICEFSHPSAAWFSALYRFYLRTVLPTAAAAFSSNAPSYTYLAESILAWPDQIGLAGMLLDTGFTGVEYRNLTGGVVALHRGVRPGAER
jgi:demethylmenaquinone methyltransferase/2-methoxy-6-polyprenyl-1,4-benzoquinol methylase